jgi:predicted MFS family arabinose efflux permease
MGFRFVYGIMLFLEIFLSFTLNYVTESRLLYAIWVLFIFLCEGGHFSIFPALACNIYGVKLGYRIYSLLFVGMALASINGLMASTFLLPYFGYGPIFVMFGMLNVLSLFLLSVFDENKLTKK